MRKIAISSVCAAALTLGACGSEPSPGEFTTADGETGEYTIDQDSNETSMTVSTPEGDATMRSGANVPVALPAGFALYPGAKVASNTVINQGDDIGNLLMFETADSPQAVATFYKDQAASAGIDIQIDAVMNGSVMVAGEHPSNGTTFSATATRDGDVTRGQLTIGTGPAS
jgi:hypothetical protein